MPGMPETRNGHCSVPVTGRRPPAARQPALGLADPGGGAREAHSSGGACRFSAQAGMAARLDAEVERHRFPPLAVGLG